MGHNDTLSFWRLVFLFLISITLKKQKNMNNKFCDLLNEFLDHECDDYGLSYSWEWNEDMQCCEVIIKKDDHAVCVAFRYNEDMNSLEIELKEGDWYITREYDSSVKYFWIAVARTLFL
jgi:hypothetical protein